MKNVLFLTLSLLTFTAFGQDKSDWVSFNQLTEVEGTPYVIASLANMEKKWRTKSRYLLFIHSLTGDTAQVAFPKDANIGKLKQVKIDSFGINWIIISAQTVDLDGKKGIGWNDPEQIIVLSPDGKKKVQLTEDSFFSKNWVVNKQTGTLVVMGYYDSNKNDEYDKSDKNEILIFNLRDLSLVAKL